MLRDLIGRLQGTAPLREVAGVGELAALKALPPAHLLPAAYVLPLAEAADPAAGDAPGSVGQIVTVRFGIVLAVAASRPDPQGGAAVAEIDPVRRAIRAALLGWCPPGADSPISYVAGDLLSVEPSGIWWQDSYETQTIYRSDT